MKGLIAAVVAIGLESLWAGLTEVVQFQIVMVLTVEVAPARLLIGPLSTPAAEYMRMDRTQCP